MSIPICTKKSVRIETQTLDLSKLNASVRIRPADFAPDDLPPGTTPVGGRVLVEKLSGWAAQTLYVRRIVGTHLGDFTPQLSASAGSTGAIELPEDLAGVEMLHVGVDTAESGLLLVGFEIDFPAPPIHGRLAAAMG